MKTYEVEFKSTTYRQYTVTAVNKKFAEERAVDELQMDTDVSSCWVENAEVVRVVDPLIDSTWMDSDGKIKNKYKK
jgi:hypothetical protein